MDEAARIARNKQWNDWYRAHKDVVHERQRDYRERNKDALNARRAAYRDSHRDELRRAERDRRSRMSDEDKDRELAIKKRRRRWFTANLAVLKTAQGCSVCGRRDSKLDYHHVDRSTKRYSVSRMAHTSLETLVDEIAKCVVLCAHCHGRLHGRGRHQPLEHLFAERR